MFCTNCGAQNDESNMFCTVCGTPMEPKEKPKPKKPSFKSKSQPMTPSSGNDGNDPMPDQNNPNGTDGRNGTMPGMAPAGAMPNAGFTPNAGDVPNTPNTPLEAPNVSGMSGMGTTAAAPKAKSNTTLVLLIAAIVVIAFAGGIGASAFIRQNNASPAQSVQAQSSQSPVYGGSDEASAGTPEQSMGKIVAVSAGGSFDLAVDDNGKAWAWGYNGHGQLGSATGSDSKSDKPVPVAITGKVTKVAAGTDHGLALTSDGTVWAWGANDHGQVGDGSAGVTVGKPTKVTGLSNVTDIDAGDRYSLALKSDGTVWSWGYGDGGRTGHGISHSEDTMSPQQIAGLSGVIDMGAGTRHGIALTNSGEYTTWTWGGGSNTDGPVPIPNAGDVAAVDAGNQFSIVLHRDGTVHGWGQNDKGQLGDGNPKAWQAQLVDADGMPSITAISVGDSHVLALGSDGSVWAWGVNDKGQLGSSGGSSITPVQLSITNATAIGGGGNRSVAATSDGKALSWGDGTSSPTTVQ